MRSQPSGGLSRRLNPPATASVHSTMHTSLPRRLSVLVLVAGLAVALSACSSSGNKGAKSPTATNPAGARGGITIANFTFSPTPVKAGSTVTVTNNDTPTHTVTADNGSFNVTIPAGKTATFTAPSKPGTYKFHCNIHHTMHGILTVT
jgi:plastocyanin